MVELPGAKGRTMKHIIPEHLDILQAVYDLYLAKKPTDRQGIARFFGDEVGQALKHRGFTVEDRVFWERLFEYNKTIEKRDEKGTIVYWLCEPNKQDARPLPGGENEGKSDIPMVFRMGVVANEIAGLIRKRALEEEQLRFWVRYKWAAIATIALTVVTSVCAIINTWIAYHKL